jgi:dipeptidyl aminopeptidase/acylaminoacyl peptidase
MGSRNNLLGEDRDDPKMVEYLSSNLQVSKDTPPSFLAHAEDDVKVPVQNSILFNQASIQKGVPSTLKIYQAGRHGFNIGRPGTDSMNWTNDCEDWLKEMNFIK